MEHIRNIDDIRRILELARRLGVAQISVGDFSAVLGPEPLNAAPESVPEKEIEPAVGQLTIEQIDGMMFNATRKL